MFYSLSIILNAQYSTSLALLNVCLLLVQSSVTPSFSSSKGCNENDMFYLFLLENLTTVGYVCLSMIDAISTILMQLQIMFLKCIWLRYSNWE